MIANEKSLFDFVDSILKKKGFVKKKNTWYWSTDECICFFSIGKSPYGGLYEDVMGCFLKELNDTGKEFPELHKSHLRYTIEELVDKDLVKSVFNLENHEFKGDEREFMIKELIEIYVIPFIEDVNTKQNIKAAIAKYSDLVYWIDTDLRKKLSIKTPK